MLQKRVTDIRSVPDQATCLSQREPIMFEGGKGRETSLLYRKKIKGDTYCLPMCSAADLEPLLSSSSAGGEKRHMLLPHYPLASECALEAARGFSFLVNTERKNGKHTWLHGTFQNLSLRNTKDHFRCN